MKKIGVFFIVLVFSMLLVAVYVFLLNPSSEHETFYVGVTYCGKSVEEAKLLIDKVKEYTNLFVLQSGPIQRNPDNVTAIGDYAVSCGLGFVVYFGTDSSSLMKTWLNTYDGSWGDQFLGVYFGDEPAGIMLDGEMGFWDQESQSSLRKMADGSTSCHHSEGNGSTSLDFCIDGRVIIELSEFNEEPPIINGTSNPDYVRITTSISYYPNGTITVEATDHFFAFTSEQNGFVPIENATLPIGNATSLAEILDDYNITFTYEQLWNDRPFQTYDETAERFINKFDSVLNRYGPQNFSYFTSDYALHWFDYKAGYDVVLAQFGWNHTLAQDLALVRGAANLQNKPWGVIITWKYNNPPYLDSGVAIYDQMVMAYENGAEYVVVFNYAEDMVGPYGTLQAEHFIALEQFWNDVVQSSDFRHGSVEAKAVLVLPENYGWGMRRLDDKIWGIWNPDEKSQRIWDLSHSLLEEYGTGLDIVYDDPQFLIGGKYPKIYYWNQANLANVVLGD